MLSAPSAQSSGLLRVVVATWPSTTSLWPVSALVSEATAKSTPSSQRSLQIRRRRRIVDRDQHAMVPSRLDQDPDVTHVQLWVGWCLDRQEPGALERAGLRVIAGERQAHVDPDRFLNQPAARPRVVQNQLGR